eukprot:7794-Eustigmatos_ZCMA.PRE.1
MCCKLRPPKLRNAAPSGIISAKMMTPSTQCDPDDAEDQGQDSSPKRHLMKLCDSESDTRVWRQSPDE